jgi:hypothetical protein
VRLESAAGPVAPAARRGISLEQSIGVRLKETNSETATAKAEVRPKADISLPMKPFMKAIGRKTAISERVVPTTAGPISRVASSEALIGSMPFSCTKR